MAGGMGGGGSQSMRDRDEMEGGPAGMGRDDESEM
jgi:hypothetical protein